RPGAGRVPDRAAPVLLRRRGVGRAGAGGDDRPAGDICVRPESGRHRALAARHRRAPGRCLRGDRPGGAAGRRGCDRRPGPAGERRGRGGKGFCRPRARDGGGQMNISELFIRRPVMTTLVMTGILVFGLMAYRLLSVSNLPNVDFPTIQVNASLPGASPETMASGVAQVNVYGAAKYAVRIQLDPKALATRGIGIDEVANGVDAGNVNLPTGILWGPHRAYTVLANGRLQNAEQFRPLVVTYRNGAPVRLQDLGSVLDDVQDNKSAAWFNGNRAIVLAIQ